MGSTGECLMAATADLLCEGWRSEFSVLQDLNP